jgi:GNAT superfamily N-acetyltransferase
MEKKRLPIEKSFMLNFHYLPKEEALKFDTASPEGIYLKQLVPADGQKINDLWPHAHNGSLYFIQRLIEMNLNIGAFTKEEDELIAWCLRIEMGSFGSLQVDERFQRRGLGSLMVKLMSRRLAEQSKDITAGIVDSNYKSRQMFQKLGFKHIDDTHWFTIAPTIPHYRWVD